MDPKLAPDHQGMRIDGRGVLARFIEASKALRAAVDTDDPERIGEVAREVAGLMDRLLVADEDDPTDEVFPGNAGGVP